MKKVLTLKSAKLDLQATNYQLFTLATNIKINELLLLCEVHNQKNIKFYEEIKKRAIKLDILEKKAPAIIQGRDLITLGLKPSKEFSILLNKSYEAQKHEVFKTHKSAMLWLKEELLS